jgi:lipoprotein-anchoring transpeptidase ErfK/SrfK
MARNSYTNRNNNYRGRKTFLITAFILVAGLAVWRLLSSRSSVEPHQSPTNTTITQANAEAPSASVITNISEEPQKLPIKTDNAKSEQVRQVSATEQAGQNAQKVKPEPAAPAKSGKAEKLLDEGRIAIERQDYMTAREKISRAMALGLPRQKAKLAESLINQASDFWLFSRRLFPNDPHCRRYQVASGDLLVNIGKKFDVPYQILMRINGIKKPSSLRAGQNIKVVQGPFHAVVDRERFMMYVYLGDVLVRVYPVSTGKPGRETPVGRWLVEVGKKQINPAWTDPDTGKQFYPDDKENPLGERWIGLKGLDGNAKGRTGFGIHGTIEPEKIGTAASRGCIRLLNKDVEELYDMLTEGKSRVQVAASGEF